MVASYQALDHHAVPIAAWRLADELAWPFVSIEDTAWKRRLAWLCRPLVERPFWQFDPATRCYLDPDGVTVRIGREIALGDLISSSGSFDDQLAMIGVLVEDRGELGLLDPSDLVVSAQAPLIGGALAERVSVHPIGALYGDIAIRGFARDSNRLEKALAGNSAERLLRPNNPIYDLEPWQITTALIGMVIVLITLFRFGRKQRRAQRAAAKQLDDMMKQQQQRRRDGV